MIRALCELLADLRLEAREEGWIIWALCAAAFFGCVATVAWIWGV